MGCDIFRPWLLGYELQAVRRNAFAGKSLAHRIQMCSGIGMNDQPRLRYALQNPRPKVQRGRNLRKIIQAAEGNVSRFFNRRGTWLGRLASNVETPVGFRKAD